MSVRPALALLALLALAGCSGSDAGPTATTTATTTATATGSASSPAPTDPTIPTTDLLDWQPVPGPTDVSVTTNGPWSVAYDEERGRATLVGPDGPIPDGTPGPVSDVLLDDHWAVIVHQDPQEQDPATAVVTQLPNGITTTIDGSTAGAPTVSGGAWALDGDRVAYATRDQAGAYCLAQADLTTGASTIVWCAADRQGFNAVHLGDAGDSLLAFDDARPACRTVATVDGTGITPFPDVSACLGFEGVVTDDGPVWSEVADPERVEAATVHARAGDTTYDLGPATSGTLTRCGDAAYFVRDPQSTADPARLMRWRDGVLSVVFESAAGQAFLAAPRCAGDTITVSSYAEGGDAQVSARVQS